MKFNKNEEVTSKLPFMPVPALDNLCLGKLIEVLVEEFETPKVNPETGVENTWEYAGIKYPKLIFRFQNIKHSSEKDIDFVDRFLTIDEMIIASTTKTGVDVKPKELEKWYTNMFKRIKHMHDAYSTTTNYKALEGDIPEIDEIAEPEVRAKQFKAFFQYFADAFNKGKDGTPMFTDIPMIIKLIADYKTGKYLTIPSFVERGFIEPFIVGKRPVIKIYTEKGETIALSGTSSKNSGTTPDNGGMSDAVADLLKSVE